MMAQTAAAAAGKPNDMVSLGALALFLTSLGGFIFSLKNKDKHKEEGRAEGLKEGQKIQMDQPFVVKLEETFVTHRQLREHKIERDREIAELKNTQEKGQIWIQGLFDKTFTKLEDQSRDLSGKLERQNERLTEALADVAKEDRAGRVAIWNKVNLDSDRITEVKAASNVSHEIGKLGEAILKQQTNGKPTSR